MSKNKEPTFTPDEDVIEAYLDGSGSKVVAKAGKAIPWSRAVMLGLVKADMSTLHQAQAGVRSHTIDDGPILDTLRGVEVSPGDVAADLAKPSTIKRS